MLLTVRVVVGGGVVDVRIVAVRRVADCACSCGWCCRREDHGCPSCC